MALVEAARSGRKPCSKRRDGTGGSDPACRGSDGHGRGAEVASAVCSAVAEASAHITPQ